MFDAGDVVICVDASPHQQAHLGAPTLVLRRMYRVAGPSPSMAEIGLEEHRGLRSITGEPWYWRPSRFRKLNDEADDRSLVTRIKNARPTRVKEDA